MVPCDLPQGNPPASPDGRQIALLWLDAERLLYQCANKHDRLIDFELEQVPPDAAPTPLTGKPTL